MILEPHIERVQQDLRAAASLGSPELAQAVEHLATALESSLRLAMIEALTAAVDELSAELAPSSIAVQMDAGDPRLVANLDLAPFDEPAAYTTSPELEPDASGEDDLARVSLRISGSLKRRVDDAAAREQLSANTWISRAIAAVLDGASTPPNRASRGTMRGWAY